MDCQRPTRNEENGKWEVWDFAYEENGDFTNFGNIRMLLNFGK